VTAEAQKPSASPSVPPGAPYQAVAKPDTAEQVGADLDELVVAAAQRDEYLALAQRTQADFENYRKRMSREVAAAEERGISRLARELLPALDNIERALAATESLSDDGSRAEGHLAEGVRLVHAELVSALGRLGIEAYTPLGEPFDPNQHEAMAQQPVEGAESGTVVEVYAPGYRLGEDIIRPAQVVVAA
jgi:molecular chaperone GrpE